MCKNSMSQAKSMSQPLAYQPDQVIGYGNYSEQCELEEGEIVDDGDGFWTDVVVEQARIRISKNLFGSNSLFNKLQRRLIFKIWKRLSFKTGFFSKFSNRPATFSNNCQVCFRNKFKSNFPKTAISGARIRRLRAANRSVCKEFYCLYRQSRKH